MFAALRSAFSDVSASQSALSGLYTEPSVVDTTACGGSPVQQSGGDASPCTPEAAPGIDFRRSEAAASSSGPRRGCMRVHTEEMHGFGLQVGAAWVQGCRPSMEDAHTIELDLGGRGDTALLAVFDGHGGSDCAQFCARSVAKVLPATSGWAADDLERALRETFHSLDEDAIKTCTCYSGATCGMLLLRGKQLVVAGVGDTRCVLCRGGKPLALTRDHKPEDAAEEDRIRAAGGFVHRGRLNACLNVSRALGDAQFKQDPEKPPCEQQVSPDPDVCQQQLDAGEDAFIVLACDGLWNALSEQQVVDFVSSRLDLQPLSEVAHSLAAACLEPCRTAYDNVTILLARLKPLPRSGSLLEAVLPEAVTGTQSS